MEVTARTKDGGVLSARCDRPRGIWGNPLTREERLTKFRRTAGVLLDPDRVRARRGAHRAARDPAVAPRADRRDGEAGVMGEAGVSATRALARFAAGTRFADLPPGLVEDLKLTVLDTLAAAFVGSVQPWARRILEVFRDLRGAPEAAVVHQDWRADAGRAALANGVLIGAFECEPLTGSHASGTVLPAALAVCERERLSGEAFLAALGVGFEVSARLARAATGLETARAFHNPGAQGPFAAAAAVGKLHGLDEDGLVHALGIAGSSAAGLLEFAWSGGDTKRLHLGRASQLGLEAAILARNGVRGPATVIEGRSGYFAAFSTAAPPDAWLDGLGTRWTIRPPWLKSYATHVTHQAVVAALQAFKQDHALDPRAITRVVIRGAPRIMEERHSERAPHDVLGGQYSLPFTTAVALTRDMSEPARVRRDRGPRRAGAGARAADRAGAGGGRRPRGARRVVVGDPARVRRRASHAPHPPLQGLVAEPVHLGRRLREIPALHALHPPRPPRRLHHRRRLSPRNHPRPLHPRPPPLAPTPAPSPPKSCVGAGSCALVLRSAFGSAFRTLPEIGSPRRLAAVCYPGRTMGAVKRRGSRPGRTAKISISLDRKDLAVLRGRARRLFEGNLSAVIAEGVRRVKEEEGREALLGWLGHAARTSPAQREAVRAEWRGKAARRRGRVA